MGNIFGSIQPPPDQNISTTTATSTPMPELTQLEKEDIARKRVLYLENRYPAKKLVVPKRTPAKQDDRSHESYLRDLRS